ncbi:integrase core domain-containing protein [Fundidesulfovibrio soli]
MVIEDWRKQHNEVRSHSSLGRMTPKTFAGMIGNNLNQGATLKY